MEHDAGRELDALIAEQVMGWIDIEQLIKGEDSRDGWIGIPPGFEGYSRLGASPFHDVPHYSTDIAAAWLVVERITRIPRSLEEAERAANTRFGYWFDRAMLWSMSAAEVAYAICLAAMEASHATN